MAPRARTPAPSADLAEIINFLAAACRDYIAARVLLNHELPLQGAIQASTAIEKYIKAVLACRGNRSVGHLKRAHFNAFRNYSPGLYAALNEEFLQFLRKIYALRYPDRLPVGFNVVIATRELLAELDSSVLLLDQAFETQQQGETLAGPIDRMREKADSRLLANNHVLASIQKQEFIVSEPQLVYEMRVARRGVSLEIHYLAAPTPSDGHFLRAGLDFSERSTGLAFEALLPPSGDSSAEP